MKRSNLITLAGATTLRNELAHIVRTLRPEVTKALGVAAAEGDRSENAEYIYRKKQLREIDHKPKDQETVFFGAEVTLEDESGTEIIYRIVGSDEFDQQPHYISVDSPMARALLKRQLDDEVRVQLPEGYKDYWITAIYYPDLNS